MLRPMATLDHALVGNGRMLALIAPGGDAAWATLTRFDSPPICAPDGGRFTLEPTAPVTHRHIAYHPSSNATRALLTTPAGRLAIDDLALPGPDPRPEWIRIIRPLDAPLTLRITFAPHLGAALPHLTPSGIDLGPLTLRHSPAPGLTPEALLRGDPLPLHAPLVLILADGPPATPPTLAAAEAALDAALAAGRARVDRLPLALPAIAHRAFATLLQHIYAPTGALIAGVVSTDATDRPRRLWLREATDAADTLLSLGLVEPARRLSTCLRTIAHGAPLRADYPIDPHHPQNPDAPAAPPERAGRILHLAHRIHTVSGARPNRHTYDWLAALIEDAADQRGRPDGGHWDGPAGAWTTSHLWSWAAFDRGARLARLLGETPRADRWAALADSEATLIRQAIAEKSLIASTLHGRQLDPAVCIARRLGFVTDDTPAWLRTVDALARTATDGLIRTPQGTRPLAATFWTAEALARAGWTDRARALFDAAAARQNPAGLLPERIDDDDRPAGRFPAVAAHTAALRAALALRPG